MSAKPSYAHSALLSFGVTVALASVASAGLPASHARIAVGSHSPTTLLDVLAEAEQAAKPAQPAPPTRPKPAAVIAGVWTGVVIRGADRYRSQWSLRQTGNRVVGTVTETRIGGSGYGQYRVTGKVTDDVLWYRAEQWLTSRPPGWCLPAGTLELGKQDGETFLSGRWRANSVAGGCGGDVSASVKLSRGKGD